MSSPSVEERLATLEAEVGRLKQIVEADKPAAGWKKIVGSFRNDPYYERAMKYGREYREAQRPKPKKRTKRKSSHGDS